MSSKKFQKVRSSVRKASFAAAAGICTVALPIHADTSDMEKQRVDVSRIMHDFKMTSQDLVTLSGTSPREAKVIAKALDYIVEHKDSPDAPEKLQMMNVVKSLSFNEKMVGLGMSAEERDTLGRIHAQALDPDTAPTGDSVVSISLDDAITLCHFDEDERRIAHEIAKKYEESAPADLSFITPQQKTVLNGLSEQEEKVFQSVIRQLGYTWPVLTSQVQKSAVPRPA